MSVTWAGVEASLRAPMALSERGLCLLCAVELSELIFGLPAAPIAAAGAMLTLRVSEVPRFICGEEPSGFPNGQTVI